MYETVCSLTPSKIYIQIAFSSINSVKGESTNVLLLCAATSPNSSDSPLKTRTRDKFWPIPEASQIMTIIHSPVKGDKSLLWSVFS